MCAIAGLIGVDISFPERERILETMARRGPDSRGTYTHGRCTLLHSRLAIIDPEGGEQPMILEWAGERYCMVYNGELYNTRELREQLEKLGHRFLGHSDTEVVLHSYVQWGEDCLDRFNGIFAFGIWEERRHRLFLARDRIGVKPLFYRKMGTDLLFASEIKTILACPGVPADLDEAGIVQILMFGPGRMPGSGVLRGISEVEPGCCGWFEQGKLTLRCYWSLKDREHRESFEETVEHVRFLVTDAIRRQMVSDVPIGTFLSGGLDSSIITAVCAGEMAQKGQQLKTWSVDYVDNDKYFRANKFQPNMDGYYIRRMTEAFHTEHHDTLLSPRDLVDVLEEATIARDLPGMADVDFSLLALCRDIRKDVKVALSGECADEIFGGYPWYRDPEVRDREGFPWAQNTAQRMQLLPPAIRSRTTPRELVMDAYLDTCRRSDVLPGTAYSERRMKEMVNLNFRWFMQTLLDRKDRMSMYCSLEVRVPFCDWRIAEYLYGVPWEFKDRDGKEKGLLRYAVADILPEAVLWRKKSPYPKTFDPGYEALIRERFDVLLSDAEAPLFAMVDQQALRTMTREELHWPWYGQLMRRPQMMAWFLQMDFWLRHYRVNILI